MPKKQSANRYVRLMEHVFFRRYKKGASEVRFEREDIEHAAKSLQIPIPKNLGDLIYSFRYRAALPDSIRQRAPEGMDWIILPAGKAQYRFALIRFATIVPNAQLAETKVPDSTPGVIATYALTDEQALLARIRYNRLVDVFTGVACYSLQSHLRTTVEELGQVETDEVYIGLGRKGVQYVLPIQAKRGGDLLNVVQVWQDVAMCREKWPGLVCRPIAAQFVAEDLIAMFELEEDPRQLVVVASEKHYRLVPPELITADELESYRRRAD